MFIIAWDGELAINTDKINYIGIEDISNLKRKYKNEYPEGTNYLVKAYLSSKKYGYIGSDSVELEDYKSFILKCFKDEHKAMEYLKDIVEKIQGKAVYI